MASTKQDGTRTSGEPTEDKSASIAANAVNDPGVPAAKPLLVAEEGETPKAETSSPEAKLAKELKSLGVDSVRVWHDEAIKLFYADMFKDGLHRLLSATDEEMDDKDIDVAKTLYAQAGFDLQDKAKEFEEKNEK